MKAVKAVLKLWKLFVALALIIAAIFVYKDKYLKEEASYQTQVQQMKQMQEVLMKSIEKNRRYESVQDKLDEAKAELEDRKSVV